MILQTAQPTQPGQYVINADGTIEWESLFATGVQAYDTETIKRNLVPWALGLGALWLVTR